MPLTKLLYCCRGIKFKFKIKFVSPYLSIFFHQLTECVHEAYRIGRASLNVNIFIHSYFIVCVFSSFISAFIVSSPFVFLTSVTPSVSIFSLLRSYAKFLYHVFFLIKGKKYNNKSVLAYQQNFIIYSTEVKLLAPTKTFQVIFKEGEEKFPGRK